MIDEVSIDGLKLQSRVSMFFISQNGIELASSIYKVGVDAKGSLSLVDSAHVGNGSAKKAILMAGIWIIHHWFRFRLRIWSSAGFTERISMTRRDGKVPYLSWLLCPLLKDTL